MNETLYKVTGPDGTAWHGGTGKWPLPQGEQPGDWVEVDGDLVPCKNGLHLCNDQTLIDWLGPVIWRPEYDGERLDTDNKIVVRRARLLFRVEAWNARTARLFACDCADQALAVLGADRVDQYSVEAIRVARLFAVGQATREELAAARDAARAAARDAARASARDAARDAAWAAAWAAARAAAWDAAWAAARAAAGDATWDAARDAAWDTAGDAAREWQTKRLLQYLNGEVNDESD